MWTRRRGSRTSALRSVCDPPPRSPTAHGNTHRKSDSLLSPHFSALTTETKKEREQRQDEIRDEFFKKASHASCSQTEVSALNVSSSMTNGVRGVRAMTQY